MVTVIEALAILFDPVYTNFQSLSEQYVGAGSMKSTVGCIRDERPI